MSYIVHGHYLPHLQHVIDVFVAQLPQEPRVGGAALTVYHQNQKIIDLHLDFNPYPFLL